jgi:hypothetical protein
MFSTSIFAYNFNLSLDNYTYNLIVEAKTFDNSQYPQCWLSTQLVTTRENATQIALTIACVVLKESY